MCIVCDVLKCQTVFTGSEEWQLTENETQLNYINITHLRFKAEYEMLLVAVNDVGKTASDNIHVLVGMPYAQFGIFPNLM